MVGWAFLFLGAVSLAIWLIGELRSKFHNSKTFWILSVLLALLIGGIFVALVGHQSEPSSPQLPVGLSLACNLGSLPVDIPPDGTMDFILLNPLRTHRADAIQGFYQVHNGGTKDYLSWPSEKQIKAAPLAMLYKCVLTNDGPTNLVEITLTTKIYYGANTKENFDLHSVVVNPLPAGAHFNFYVINECRPNAVIIMPEEVVLQVVGEEKRRQVRLHTAATNTVENALWFPFGGFDQLTEPCQQIP
jgi:hypothetical protein